MFYLLTSSIDLKFGNIFKIQHTKYTIISYPEVVHMPESVFNDRHSGTNYKVLTLATNTSAFGNIFFRSTKVLTNNVFGSSKHVRTVNHRRAAFTRHANTHTSARSHDQKLIIELLNTKFAPKTKRCRARQLFICPTRVRLTTPCDLFTRERTNVFY